MSTLDEITAAIERLPASDVARVRAWLAEYADRLWDEQIRARRAGRPTRGVLDNHCSRGLQQSCYLLTYRRRARCVKASHSRGSRFKSSSAFKTLSSFRSISDKRFSSTGAIEGEPAS